MRRKAEEHCVTLLNKVNAKKKQLKDMTDKMRSARTTSSGRTRRPTIEIQEAIDNRNNFVNDEIERILKEVNESTPSLSEAKKEWEKMKEMVKNVWRRVQV